MEYNSSRPQLIIPEYGRNIQNMISFCKGVEDREERNRVAQAIISVMGQLFPYLRDIEDYKHKLWDHLHIMSNFELDVESPYPMPEVEQLSERPEMLKYPQRNFNFSHYGTWLENLLKKAMEMELGDERDTLTLIVANLMKKHYITYNRDSVEDEVILNQLRELSGGQLALKEGETLTSLQDLRKDIPQITAPKKQQHIRKGGSNNHQKSKGKYSQQRRKR